MLPQEEAKRSELRATVGGSRPMDSNTAVQREKAAIENTQEAAYVVIDQIRDTLTMLNERLQPVSGQIPMETPDIDNDPPMGSSQVYNRAYEQLYTLRKINLAIHAIKDNLEV